MKSLHLITLYTSLCLTIGVSGTMAAEAPNAGGYHSVAVSDQRVVAAARFAVVERAKTEPAKLLKIVKAKRQVVAGTNYRLTLKLKQKKKIRSAVATVYVDLQTHKSLTAWQWLTAK